MTLDNRIEWIDLTKGIAIFLMVCGHTSIPMTVSNFIWCFHMPLFFIVSGMLYRPEKAEDYKRYVINKIKILVIPYFFFLICDFLYRYTWGLDFSWKMLTDGIQIGAYWFLQVLLVVELLNAVLIKFLCENTNSKDGRVWYLFSIIILAILGYYAYLKNIHLPYRLEVVGLASLHYGFGFIFKNMIKDYKIGIWLSLLLIGFTLLFSQILPRLDMNFNQFGSFVPNILLAWMGTISVMMISKNLEDLKDSNLIKRFLLWAGQFSIVVMGLSQPINMSLKYSLEMMALPHVVSVAVQHSSLWLILVILSYFLNHYLPALIGKKITS